jgi:hypothetical protein
MALQYSVTVRNARLDVVESTISTSPILEIFDGAIPANCAAADVGTKLCQLALPSDWMAAASGGTKAKANTWSGTGSGTGAARYFRIKDSGSPDTTHIQGTVGPTGSPTFDMTVDNVNIAPGQAITVSTFTLTAGNA